MSADEPVAPVPDADHYGPVVEFMDRPGWDICPSCRFDNPTDFEHCLRCGAGLDAGRP